MSLTSLNLGLCTLAELQKDSSWPGPSTKDHLFEPSDRRTGTKNSPASLNPQENWFDRTRLMKALSTSRLII